MPLLLVSWASCKVKKDQVVLISSKKSQLDKLTRLAKEGSEFLKPEEVMQALEKFTKQKGEAALEAAVKKFAENLSQLTFETPQGAPDRIDMPVIDPGKVKDADKIAMQALQGGEIDWNEPKA